MKSLQMIKDLCMAFGAPGFEDDVLDVARRYIPTDIDIKEDKMRNLYLYPKKEINPNIPTVLIDAHTDEVGLMVQHIKPNGTLAFTDLGEWVAHVLSAQKVKIKNLDGNYITGVVASKPPHFGGGQVPTSTEGMVIDIGASSEKEVREHFKIAPACPIVPDTIFEHDPANDIVISKAFDCRLGCAAVIDTLEAVKRLSLGVNLIGALSAQEEIGTRGAQVVGNTIKPDIAICFEGTPADDTFLEEHQIQTRLKHGPMLRHIDKGMITHPRFIRFALNVAKSLDIPVQEAVRTGGWTNAERYHLSHHGIPTIVIGQPVRYGHSHNSIACLSDYKAGVKLAAEIIKALNSEVFAGF